MYEFSLAIDLRQGNKFVAHEEGSETLCHQELLDAYWEMPYRRRDADETQGMDAIPVLVTTWTIQTSEGDGTTDLIQPHFIVQNTIFKTHIHQCLLLTPEGLPLLVFSSLCELLSILIDIIDDTLLAYF